MSLWRKNHLQKMSSSLRGSKKEKKFGQRCFEQKDGLIQMGNDSFDKIITIIEAFI